MKKITNILNKEGEDGFTLLNNICIYTCSFFVAVLAVLAVPGFASILLAISKI